MEGLKNFIYAGIGLAATTSEKVKTTVVNYFQFYNSFLCLHQIYNVIMIKTVFFQQIIQKLIRKDCQRKKVQEEIILTHRNIIFRENNY